MKTYFTACGLFLLCQLIHAQQPNVAPLSGGFPQSFATSPNQLGAIQSSVNLFTGDVQFPIPLASIAGRNGLDINLSISYSSNVHRQSNTWNAEAPTGVVGLGWSLDFPKIVVDNKMTGTREDDVFYISEGGGTMQLFFVGGDAITGKIYKPNVHQFWIIKYFPNDEKWEITKEDGTQIIYGDKNNGRSSVQWIVHWNNWIGSSNVTTSTIQKQQALVWNIAEVKNVWGEKIFYNYLNVNQRVGSSSGKEHTEASYLSSITDAIGRKVILNYGNKTTDEYYEPHTENGTNAIDAYQERYERLFLNEVIVNDELDQQVNKVALGYSFLGTGDLTKRLLSTITSYNHANELLPGYSFSYITTNPSSSNYGALLNINTPMKGVVSFDYFQNAISRAIREKKITALVGYLEPKVWIGPDYVIVTWREATTTSHSASAKTVKLQVFSWDGEWIEWNLNETLNGITYVESDGSFASLTDQVYEYQNFQLTLQSDFFAIHYNTNGSSINYLKIFRKDDYGRGKWTKYEESFTVGQQSETNIRANYDLISGENFVARAGLWSSIRTYMWNGTTWEVSHIGRLLKKHDNAVAGHNYIISHSQNPDLITFSFLKEDGTWVNKTAPNFQNNTVNLNTRWYPSASFTIAMVDNNQEHVFWWDENFNIQNQSIGFAVDTYSYVETINNSMIGILDVGPLNGYAVRFNGVSWSATSPMSYEGVSVSSGRTSQSYGEDFIVNSKSGSSTIASNRFNPNTNSWTSQSFNTKNKYLLFAGHNYFVSVNDTDETKASVYFRRPNGLFVKDPVQVSGLHRVNNEPAPAFFECRYGWQGGLDFVVKTKNYSDPCGSISISFKNGKIDSNKTGFTSGTTFDYDCPVFHEIDYADPTRVMVYGNTLVGFLNNTTPGNINQRNASDLRLYKLIDEKATGSINDYPVTTVSVNSGSQTMSTYIGYDVTKATYDPSGLTCQYNQVTIYPGVSNASTINGRTEYSFFNGIESAVAGNFPTEPIGIDYNTYSKALTGTAYKTKVFNNLGNPVSESTNSLQFFNNTIMRGAAAIAKSIWVRPYSSISLQDGVTSKTVSVINTANGMPAQSISYGNNTTHVETTYGFQHYPDMLSKNMLTTPIGSRTIVNGQTIESSVTRIKNWGAFNTPAEFDSYSWTHNGSETFTNYDINQQPASNWFFNGQINVRDYYTGAPLETMGSANQLASLILDTNKRYPIAEVANTTLNEVGFTSFEDETPTTINLGSGSTITTGDAKTGRKHLTLGTGGINRSVNSVKEYKLSFWAKSAGGTIGISGNTNLVVNSPNDWKYFEYKITGQSTLSLVKISGSSVLVDEVRIHPVGARMITKTYDPKFGITSETGFNNQSIYIEYDSFGRVKAVMNQDKNIVKSYTYKNKE